MDSLAKIRKRPDGEDRCHISVKTR